MKLTKRQINLVTKIYSLAILVNWSGCADFTNQEQEFIHEKLRKDAEKKFFKMFPNENNIPVTLQKCIELARRS